MALTSGAGWLACAKAAAADSEPMRHVHIRSINPAFGALASIDNEQRVELYRGIDLQVTSRSAHSLTFTCVRDMCEPQTVPLRPGTSTRELDVELKIRPAKLVIIGEPGHRYQIDEEPGLDLLPVVPSSIPLKTGKRVVHVTDLETKRTTVVVLTAGQQSLVVVL